MREKVYSYINQIAKATALSGIIMILIGAYYYMIKAGIPYQDPQLELQIQYEVNLRVGEILFKNGIGTTVLGLTVARFIKSK